MSNNRELDVSVLGRNSLARLENDELGSWYDESYKHLNELRITTTPYGLARNIGICDKVTYDNLRSKILSDYDLKLYITWRLHKEGFSELIKRGRGEFLVDLIDSFSPDLWSGSDEEAFQGWIHLNMDKELFNRLVSSSYGRQELYRCTSKNSYFADVMIGYVSRESLGVLWQKDIYGHYLLYDIINNVDGEFRMPEIQLHEYYKMITKMKYNPLMELILEKDPHWLHRIASSVDSKTFARTALSLVVFDTCSVVHFAPLISEDMYLKFLNGERDEIKFLNLLLENHKESAEIVASLLDKKTYDYLMGSSEGKNLLDLISGLHPAGAKVLTKFSSVKDTLTKDLPLV